MPGVPLEEGCAEVPVRVSSARTTRRGVHRRERAVEGSQYGISCTRRAARAACPTGPRAMRVNDYAQRFVAPASWLQRRLRLGQASRWRPRSTSQPRISTAGMATSTITRVTVVAGVAAGNRPVDSSSTSRVFEPRADWCGRDRWFRQVLTTRITGEDVGPCEARTRDARRRSSPTCTSVPVDRHGRGSTARAPSPSRFGSGQCQSKQAASVPITRSCWPSVSAGYIGSDSSPAYARSVSG